MKPNFLIKAFFAYFLMVVFRPLNLSGQIIHFQDSKVEALCVANWDTDGDGKLSIDEAAVVTNLGTVFKGNKECMRFDELRYFISLNGIAFYAFDGCSSLTSVIIPNSVAWIGWDAFQNCSSLTSVNIPNSVATIGGSAFWGCSSLTSVTIPNSVASIGNSAFWGCSSLTSVTIPNSVTSIGAHTFYGCSSLTSVNMGNSVTSIGEYNQEIKGETNVEIIPVSA